MKGDTRCIEGRLFRHDPQCDDPDLETDIGQCPKCNGDSCEDRRPSIPVGELTPEQLSIQNDMFAAWVGEPRYREAFRDDCKRLLAAAAPVAQRLSIAENETARDWTIANCVDEWRARDPKDERALVDVLAEHGLVVSTNTAPVAQEPVAYRYRWKIDGEWTSWRVSDHSQKVTGCLPTLEEVPLYTSPPATSAGVGADEIARAYLVGRGFDHGKIDDVKASGSRDWKEAMTNALALLSRAGDQK